MSHELRTPLNAIAGYVDLLEMGVRGSLSDVQRVDLGRIKQNQQTLLRLIEDVLGYAKIESGRVEFNVVEIPIDDLLRTLEVFVAPTLQRKRIEYHFEPCGSSAVALADRGKVEQILLNLLSNAAKFIRSGRIEVRCVVQDRWLEVRVVDTGPGIRPELLDRIFEPFIQADQQLTRTAEGTGLGLAISRQLARGMGGDVSVSSDVGRGSTFALSLPRAVR
jgi:signal transduction histidine kinase